MYNPPFPMPRRSIFYPLSSLLLLSLVMLSGCAVFGLAAQAVPKYVKAAYPGLKGQKVAVLVVADRGVRMDWETLNIDCTNAIQMKLQHLQKTDKPAELKDTIFPYEPRQMIRYQRDHPELELTPPSEIAQRINVTRLIFVEINNLTSRSEMASQLYKGKAAASVKVIEVEGGRGKEVYSDSVNVTFPPNTKEGVLNANDYVIYRGTVDLLSTEIVHKFVEHQVE